MGKNVREHKYKWNGLFLFKLSKMFCVRVIQQTNDAYKYYIKNKNNDHLFEDLQVLKT